jgi:hypothetical protein
VTAIAPEQDVVDLPDLDEPILCEAQIPPGSGIWCGQVATYDARFTCLGADCGRRDRRFICGDHAAKMAAWAGVARCRCESVGRFVVLALGGAR